MKDLKEFANDLNTLLARSRDAAKGYEEAAQNLNNGSELHRWMTDYAMQRRNFTVELASEIRTIGGDPDIDTSILGDLHRAWIDIKGTFSNNENKAMLEECHRGETSAFDDYQDILDEDDYVIPVSTRQMLVAQQSKIKGAIAQIETMLKVEEDLVSA